MKKRKFLFVSFNLFLIIISFLHIDVVSGQNAGSIDLSGKWKVNWNDGTKGPTFENGYLKFDPNFDSLRYITVDVPMDLNLALQKKGLIGDIYYGMNTLSAGWVSRQYWQYYRYFTVPKEAMSKTAWLVFDRLDYNATFFVNGVEASKQKKS